MKRFLFVILIVAVCSAASGQNTAVENLKIAIEFNQKKEYESSLLFCNKALESKPESTDAWFLRGVNNFNLENYKDAIVDFTVAINFDPEYADAWFYRGKAKQADGNMVGALSDYNEARMRNPSKSAMLFIKSIFSSLFGGSGKKNDQKAKQ